LIIFGRRWKNLDNYFSSLHKKYLTDLKRKKYLILFVQIIILLSFVVIWQISSNKLWIDPLLFSSPMDIFNLLKLRIGEGYFTPHIVMTVSETVAAFIISTVFGTLIAAMLWWHSFASNVLDPYLVVLNALPKVAIGPIIIVIFGPNIISVIAMGVIISIIVTTLVIYQSFRDTEPNYILVVKSFGASKAQIFKKVIFPCSFPTIVSSLKVNVGLAWVGIIVGEFLVSRQGLGYLIVYGFQVFDFTLVLTSVCIILIFAALMYIIVDRVEKYVVGNREFNR
jgi:NitT/TauT family transport system permease protein